MTPARSTLTIFRKWAREAPYGTSFTYHLSCKPRQEEAFDYARKLSDAGLVFLYQKRTPDGWAYCARRIHHAAHNSLDRISAATKVAPSALAVYEQRSGGPQNPFRKKVA